MGLDGGKLGWPMMRFIPWALIIPLLLGGCEKKTPAERKEVLSGPDQVLEKSSITFTSEGKRTTVVYADRISKYLEEEKAVLQGVRTEFYSQEGELSSTLTSREGTVFEGREEVEAKGEVVVITSEGVKLETPLLRWNTRTNRVYTDSTVKISREEEMVMGIGLEADPELKQIKIKAEVKGRIEGLSVDEGE